MRAWMAGVLLLVMAGVAVAQEGGEKPLDDDAAVTAALDAKLPLLDRDKVTIAQALRYLGGMSRVNVYVDEHALAAAGYEVDKPTAAVTANGITLRQCLNNLVKSYENPKAPLRWAVDSGVIVLSTAADTNWKTMPEAVAKYGQAEAFKSDLVIPELALEGTRLEEALKLLRDHGVNVFVRWNALEPININRHNKVALQLNKVRPKTAVQMLVRRLAGPKGEVSFAIYDGVWVISTPADLKKQVSLWTQRPYNVGDQESANKLVTAIDDASFDKPLGEALADLARLVDVKIDVDWTSLKDAGVEPTTQVNIAAKQVKLSTAIDLLLADASGTEKHLDYSAKDGVIKITMKPEPAVATTTKPATKPTTQPVKAAAKK